MQDSVPPPAAVLTIGHSTHPLERFVALLRAHEVRAIADVRRFPGSRRHPHFSREALLASLPPLGIAYQHFPGLGGRRRSSGQSRNMGWREPSFRAYADYMESGEFRESLDQLLAFAARQPTAVMCAEAQWWRCHRQLVADALVVRGVEVRHILSPTQSPRHELTSFARVEDGQLHYPALF